MTTSIPVEPASAHEETEGEKAVRILKLVEEYADEMATYEKKGYSDFSDGIMSAYARILEFIRIEKQ